MARPVAAPVPVASPIDALRAAGVGVTLLLAVFLAWPVAALLVHGLPSPVESWPWRIAAQTVVVALSSAFVAFGLAALVAFTLTRTDVPGRITLCRIYEAGALIPPFIVPLAVLVLTGLLAPGAQHRGLALIVVAQSLAFLPYAVALVVRMLAPISLELEQAAEVLGASRATIMRRVTLGLAGPGLLRAGLVVVTLGLGDVATPLLLGGDARVLSTEIVAAAAIEGPGAARAALLLAGFATLVALAAGAWRLAGEVGRDRPVLPRLDRPTPALLRWLLGAVAWVIAVALAALWLLVPLGSVLRLSSGSFALSSESWAVVATADVLRSLGGSLLLGLGAALAGTALALVTAWIEGPAGIWSRAVALVTRVPVVVPGVAAGAGYLLVAGRLSSIALATLILIAIVACWELPVTSRVAREVRLRMDRSVADAAVGLGASRATTLTRIVVPGLRPVAGWLVGHLFAAAVLAVGSVIVVAGPGRELGALTMLRLAAAGATGAACAVATALLAFAGGAVLLGRAIAGHQRGSTLHA